MVEIATTCTIELRQDHWRELCRLPLAVDSPRARFSRRALQDEQDPRADAAFGRMKKEEAVVPSLWWFEIRNILVVNERRKRITESDTGVFLRDLAGLRVRVDREPEESVVLRLARTHGLSVYDASYLELALREAIPLATLDAQLITAARAGGSGLI